MVGGQMLDMEAEEQSISSMKQIRRIQCHKTGALFRFACEAGAILGGSPRPLLRKYADHIGLAFQVADDLLDVESTPSQLGKATQKDRNSGKATFVDLLGRDGAHELAQKEVDQAVTALKAYGAKADVLRAAAQFIISRKT
jgi:farnesyl diphosphate synthase